MGNSGPKLHHYVPQVYLRGFAKGAKRKEMIEVLSVANRVRFTSNISGIAAQAQFNRVDGDDPLAVEKWLGRIESDAKEVIDAVAGNAGNVGAGKRHALSDFIALQSFRGPDARALVDRVTQETFQKLNEYAKQTIVTRDALALLGFDPSRFDVDEINSAGRRGEDYFPHPVEVPREDHIDLMIRTAQGVLPAILFSPWKIIHFDEARLLTSDAPVTKFATGNMDEVVLGAGIAINTIIFPLTRTCALTIPPDNTLGRDGRAEVKRNLSRAGHFDVHVSGGSAQADVINTITRNGAHAYLYSHPDDAHLLG